MNLPLDILDKVMAGEMNANDAALEAAARVRIPNYTPFSVSPTDLKHRFKERPAASTQPLFNKQERLSALLTHVRVCRVHKGKCLECAEFYDLAGHDTYMDEKWRRDEEKTAPGVVRRQEYIGEPFKPNTVIEAAVDVGMGCTQYVILFDGGKAYMTIDAKGRVHSQDLRGVPLLELPALMCQILDSAQRHVIKK